jgi:hypothetical protein
MTSKALVEEFISQPKLALIGVSRSGTKFSNAAQAELQAKGYTVYGINPAGGNVKGNTIYTSLADLPETVDTAIIMLKQEQTAGAVQDCVRHGIRRVWIQQGSESAEALRICREGGVQVICNECIMMFAGKAGFHRFHRVLREFFGRKLE